MKRLITQKLIEWKSNPQKKPLLIYGARQVGKTTTIFNFATEHYSNVVMLNFEGNEPLKQIFNKDIDPKRIITELKNLTGKSITKGDTLIFFDEIQECPKAITSLKYFYEQEPGLHIIAAGSLLGVALNRNVKKNDSEIHEGISFPVGKVTPMTFYPMNFCEFLMQINPHILETIRECFTTNKPMSDALHQKALELYRIYLFTGGMPKAVFEYTLGKESDFVRLAQTEILSLYYSDMGKYSSKSEQVKIDSVYNSIPFQLAKENRKFQYSVIGSGARAASYEIGLHWLRNAGLIIQVNKVREGKYPLSSFTDALSYKVYMNDVGLLNAKSNISYNRIIGESVADETRGAMAENYVAAELVANGIIPFYWESEGKAEVDFVAQIEDESIPIEVKAAIRTQSKSLNVYMDKYKPKYAIRISAKNFGFENNIKSVPLYAVWCLSY